MRLSDGVEWSAHVCTVLATLPADRTLPAARLAEFHDLPAAYLAKHLQAMARAGIVESTPGRHGGYRLARPADAVTLLDIVEAVEGTEPAFRCTEIRQQGPAAGSPESYPAPCGIAAAFARADAAWRRALRERTVADLLQSLFRTGDPDALVAGATWIADVLRR